MAAAAGDDALQVLQELVQGLDMTGEAFRAAASDGGSSGSSIDVQAVLLGSIARAMLEMTDFQIFQFLNDFPQTQNTLITHVVH